jgi:uncharacterized protein YecE (DUF72 family)
MNSRGLNPSLIRFGTSSFSSKDWIGPFYPRGTSPRDFLPYYASRFDTVEIDATYYAIPVPRVVEAWAQRTPPGFLVAAKFPREIVNGGPGRTPDPEKLLLPDTTYRARDVFLEVMRTLGPRLGPLLLQFPFFNATAFPHPEVFQERLDRFLYDLPRDLHIAVEIRNREWLTEPLAQICRARQAALVLVDQGWMPHGDEVQRRLDPITAPFAYIRLLGDRPIIEAVTTTWGKEVLDRAPRLERWADLLARLLAREVPTLVYANNHYAGHAPATVERLRLAFLSRVEERRNADTLHPARSPVTSPGAP